jgi:hypothetical protein
MVVRIALARKLIVRLNAIARDARRQIPITPDTPDSRFPSAPDRVRGSGRG